jgi:hypothetical protein
MKVKPLKRIKMSTNDIGGDHDPTQGGPVPIHHNNGDLRSDRPNLRLCGMTRETASDSNIAYAMSSEY